MGGGSAGEDRPLEEWLTVVKKEGPKDEKARREWLKIKPKLGPIPLGGSRSAQRVLAHYKGKPPKRLFDTGGLAKKDRITHRLELTSASQIDAEVKKWLKTPYDLDA